ncbi:hypothetical protein BRADI_2g36316v3 [Brachypodium distachyon]|uniref:Uncharacterized protein n=1 Tax=Brachypodium distachyon TaxID=15368 RepID=A0A0Q3R277_BRADI|nr:hypothetical protein BRADI_2g36316v3 [Brachypodium distachyon]
MQEIGVDKGYKLVEKVVHVMEKARPLISKVHDSNLLKDVEIIAKGLADASDDLRWLKSSVLTVENTDLIKKSIFTIIYTLKNIESISSDVSGFTGDEATTRNIKLLIKSLRRLL